MGKTPTQTLGMFQQVYGDKTMPHTHVFVLSFVWVFFVEGGVLVWGFFLGGVLGYTKYVEGHGKGTDDSRSETPSTRRTEVNAEWVKQVLHGHCRLTVGMSANQLDMKKDTIWKIITEYLGMSEK